jgi:hypothetical protein
VLDIATMNNYRRRDRSDFESVCGTSPEDRLSTTDPLAHPKISRYAAECNMITNKQTQKYHAPPQYCETTVFVGQLWRKRFFSSTRIILSFGEDIFTACYVGCFFDFLIDLIDLSRGPKTVYVQSPIYVRVCSI